MNVSNPILKWLVWVPSPYYLASNVVIYFYENDFGSTILTIHPSES